MIVTDGKINGFRVNMLGDLRARRRHVDLTQVLISVLDGTRLRRSSGSGPCYVDKCLPHPRREGGSCDCQVPSNRRHGLPKLER